MEANKPEEGLGVYFKPGRKDFTKMLQSMVMPGCEAPFPLKPCVRLHARLLFFQHFIPEKWLGGLEDISALHGEEEC